jgi:predicted hydrolase (HD superfamily)
MPTRENAWILLNKYNKTDSLIKHALAVEGVMRHFARKFGGNEDEWGIIGLIHDLDYEMYPEEHCVKTKEILLENNWPDHLIRAVMSHGYGMVTDVEPQSLMEKTLYTIDELTGLITAAAYMRPSKSVMDMEVKSVMKKFKTKSFAAGVDREIILKGCDLLGMDIKEVISECILGMRAIAPSIGM